MAKTFNDLSAPIQGAVFGAVALIAAGVVFYMYILPLSDQRDGLKREVAQIKAENDRNEAFRIQQTEYLSRIRQLETQLVTLQSIVPDEQATDEFIKTVFADGYNTDVHIRTFIPKTAVTKDYYVELPYAVRLDGTYYDLVSFFDRLAHEQRIMSVSGLSLGNPEGGGMGTYKLSSGETVGANCVLTTYYNKPLNSASPTLPKR